MDKTGQENIKDIDNSGQKNIKDIDNTGKENLKIDQKAIMYIIVKKII